MPQGLLIFCWILIGAILRFSNLTVKPPWTDEFATMVFSLGNQFQSVPLNQIISPELLLSPLLINSEATLNGVGALILSQDNHPPLYFMLAHLWIQLFPQSSNYLSLWVARSLPALFGVLSIPLFYWMGRSIFSSRLAGQITAALAAVCPYAVFLAQESRHYTFVLLFVIVSVGCFVLATQAAIQGKKISWKIVFGWILANGLGLSAHYFFVITLLIEALTLTIFLLSSAKAKIENFHLNCWRFAVTALGTISTSAVWLAVIIPQGYGNQMTGWIGNVYFDILTILGPIFQFLAAWISILALLPVEAESWWIILPSGALMLGYFIWVMPILWRGWRQNWQQPKLAIGTKVLWGGMASAVTIYLVTAYIGQVDITRGARYHFAYFPILLVLIASSLIPCWEKGDKQDKTQLSEQTTLMSKILFFFRRDRRSAVIVIWLMGLISSITVVSNLGYQKYYRAEILFPIIEQHSTHPVLIATTHESLVQTGEMMSIAWEINQQSAQKDVNFLLLDKLTQNPDQINQKLSNALTAIPTDVDLWTINFNTPIGLEQCQVDSSKFPYVDGYRYNHYLCSTS